MFSYNDIEEKWQKEWRSAKADESDQNDKPSLLVTAAWPYVNMPPHMGHMKTYSIADFYARYMRMRGFNVLFPMGWHYTGTPILAIAKRLMRGDKDLLEELSAFGITEEVSKELTDPLKIADYFRNSFKEGFTMAGYSIDWRREFNSIDPLFSKMVEWQFGKLIEHGLIVKGTHPVGWCNNEGNAVGQHDTKGDTQPEIESMYAIKFSSYGEEASFVCATYRPETLYGATNLFINKDAEYVLAKHGSEKYYISKESFENLAAQIDIVMERPVEPGELLSKNAVNPINGEHIPVLNGNFVKPDFGTGVVMAVPAHAPFDYFALKKIENGPKDFKKVIKLSAEKEAGDEIPALAYVKGFAKDIENPSAEQLENATKKLYKDELAYGIMAEGEFAGEPVSSARSKIAEKLGSEGKLFEMYVLVNDKPLYCRCGYKVVVKLIKDQWFIDYGNREWKAKVLEHLPALKIYPEKLMASFNAAVEWINLRATERAQGLGTRFPLNKDHIIESLSDSTIYMSFYTFANILRQYGVNAEQLKPEFFDYVFNGKGNAEELAKSASIEIDAIKKCRESFSYWYRFTSRHSASELLPSHITMYVFNHVAVFDKPYWPKQIVLNGVVLFEGKKMSKSLGNVIPMAKAIKDYGADPIRFLMVANSDLSTDTDFTNEGVNGIRSKIAYLYDIINAANDMDAGALVHIDYWLYSKLNSKIKKATEYMEVLSLRNAYVEIFYESVNELKWYIDRNGRNQMALMDFIEKLILMLAPAMPHVAEEFWHMIGRSTLVVKEQWPVADESMISEKEEFIEDVIRSTLEDVEKAVRLTAPKGSEGTKPKRIHIIMPAAYKLKAYNELASSKSIAKTMDAMNMKEQGSKEKLAAFLSRYSKSMNSLVPIPQLSQNDMYESFAQAEGFLSAKTGSGIKIEREEDSASKRADRAEPSRPAIDIEWG
ncbi:leucine--tRNA ligase [Candidatus Marsarchaeota archaeon]|nr:leucine--tRNA ligase [Candidatus Marsarchaeota archaeon]MCL5404218.1 leucine--tRNA ligase [Candidatus Marsarchaeota archaeon]